jgi:hypothetical protein
MSACSQLCSPTVVGTWVSTDKVLPTREAGNIGVIGSWCDSPSPIVHSSGIVGVAVALSAPVQAIVTCSPAAPVFPVTDDGNFFIVRTASGRTQVPLDLLS